MPRLPACGVPGIDARGHLAVVHHLLQLRGSVASKPSVAPTEPTTTADAAPPAATSGVQPRHHTPSIFRAAVGPRLLPGHLHRVRQGRRGDAQHQPTDLDQRRALAGTLRGHDSRRFELLPRLRPRKRSWRARALYLPARERRPPIRRLHVAPVRRQQRPPLLSVWHSQPAATAGVRLRQHPHKAVRIRRQPGQRVHELPAERLFQASGRGQQASRRVCGAGEAHHHLPRVRQRRRNLRTLLCPRSPWNAQGLPHHRKRTSAQSATAGVAADASATTSIPVASDLRVPLPRRTGHVPTQPDLPRNAVPRRRSRFGVPSGLRLRNSSAPLII